MLLTKIKKSIELKTRPKYKLPDDESLQDIIHEASLYVANRCDPAELTRYVITNEIVIKQIEGGKFIVEPEYPDLSKTERHLQMDELLSYAVIYYACFLLTTDIVYKKSLQMKR